MRATTATIADRAGISLRSVFRYYNDLPGLLTAALDEYHHRLGPWTLPPPPPGIPLTERIVVIAEHHTRLACCGSLKFPAVDHRSSPGVEWGGVLGVSVR